MSRSACGIASAEAFLYAASAVRFEIRDGLLHPKMTPFERRFLRVGPTLPLSLM